MFKRRLFVAAAALAWAGTVLPADELTAVERAWFAAAAPVLAYARQVGLPLDLVVQPQPTPGETPVGLAYVDGRCKLVLSMRGNPEAEATRASIPPGLFGPVVEAIAAHELAHCWRHVSGRWGSAPARADQADVLGRVAPEHAELLRDMWRTRREEGYADLVGLAWTLRHHPGHFTAVHAWHARLRAKQELDTGPHDTRVWVRLALDPGRFVAAPTIFEQVEPLWQDGLLAWL